MLAEAGEIEFGGLAAVFELRVRAGEADGKAERNADQKTKSVAHGDTILFAKKGVSRKRELGEEHAQSDRREERGRVSRREKKKEGR